MIRFILFLTILCLVLPSGHTQTLGFGKGKTSTYAVVVGISDYRDDAIPDLKFANKDAEMFIEYLQSDAGGNLTDEQIKILLNSEATTSRIASAMDWLIEQISEGDQAIIYFSGHGDVETKTSMQHGFLLTHDSPPTTYIAGAYPLFYLQSIITTLSIEKKAKVFMIMDACHAGKLAGSAIGGSAATSSVLSKQYANEIKIMSCQPDEFSLEGVQWGGGRGVFSYHLIDGLKGMADSNEDFKVSLLEIERYLEDKVSEEVAPNSQIPMSVGLKSQVVAYVDEVILNDLRAAKDLELNTLAMIDTRGIDTDFWLSIDTSIYQKYQLFLQAIENDQLLETWVEKSGNNTNICADQLYKDLINNNSLRPLFNTMKRRLMVALQEDAQDRLNEYLSISKRQINSQGLDLNAEIKENKRYSDYLERCAELLGPDHYMYNDVKSKQLYFSSLTDYDMASLNLEDRDSLLHSSLNILQEGFSYQSKAAYILVEIARVHSDLNNYENAIKYAKQANELCPKWPVPTFILAADFLNKGDYDLAIEYAKSTLELQPEFEDAFSVLVNAHYLKEDYAEIIEYCRQTIEKYPEYLIAYLELAMAQLTLNQADEAKKSILKAVDLAPNNPLVYAYLGEIYNETGDIKKAVDALNKSISLDGFDPYPYSILAEIHHKNGDLNSAISIVNKAIKIIPDDYFLMSQLGLLQIENKNFETAHSLFEKARILAPESPHISFNMFCYHYSKGEDSKAFEWLEKAFENGLIHFIENQELLAFDCFQKVKKTDRYKQMVQKRIGQKQ